jgi:hypothetical protein
MVSSPEESVGLLPAGFLYEREVEPVGRYYYFIIFPRDKKN